MGHVLLIFVNLIKSVVTLKANKQRHVIINIAHRTISAETNAITTSYTQAATNTRTNNVNILIARGRDRNATSMPPWQQH